MNELKRKLILLRHEKNFNNQGLSDYLGFSKASIKNWINGRFQPSEANMLILDMTFDEQGIK